jgi:predicted flap endonuclease-1-like 5' DNA nuclease
MVLSDSDLTALVEWTRTRLALRRYRDGWGVVCGLDVRCLPGRPGMVVVDPGYAVGCCGEDLVVCAPTCVDLSGCCAAEEPCPQPEQTGKETEEPRDPCGDVVVDLVLVADEVLAITELVDQCGCGGDCSGKRVVPTRLREGVRVDVRHVPFPNTDPAAAAAEQAQAAYTRCQEIVTRYLQEGNGERTANQVLQWLRKQQLDPPCGWWDTTCEAVKAADGPEQLDGAVAAALFDLVVDCRRRLLRRWCEPCGGGDRVGLARVWLRRPDPEDKEQTCSVVHVDAYPPYRRELQPFARPVKAGAQDLAPFIWQRWEQVCHLWRAAAHDGTVKWVKPPGSTKDLLELLTATDDLSWDCTEDPPVPVVVTTGCLGERVVGFRPRGDEVETIATPTTPTPTPPTAPTTPTTPGTTPPTTPTAPTTPGTSAPATPATRATPGTVGLAKPGVTVKLPGAAPSQREDTNLEAVKGIGKAFAKRLRDENIMTVEQLASETLDRLDEILGSRVNVSAVRTDATRRSARPK